MYKKKSIFLSTPSGTYNNFDAAYKEARALIAHVKYYCQKRNYNIFNILIGVSNINPRLAEYRAIPTGVGHPTRDLIWKSAKCPYTEPHLHILIIMSEHADTIAKIINEYLCKRHSSTINSAYSLHVRKNEIPSYDIERVSDYISIQSQNLFSCKSRIKESIDIDLFNENESNDTLAYNEDESKTNNTFNKEQNELLFNLRFSYLLAKFLFNLSKLFNSVYCKELLNIRNQLCMAANYTKNHYLREAYSLHDNITISLTHIHQAIRTFLDESNLSDSKLLELESENIYQKICKKLVKSGFSYNYNISM